MTDSAVLFDIDGTLVDSNYAHVHAWTRAFAEAGHPVDAWRTHRAIGMDSSKLLAELLGDDAETEVGEKAKDLHAEYYADEQSGLHTFRGARELIQALTARGVRVVLATSAPQNELDRLLEILDVTDIVHAITSSADVDTAKPEPDVIGVALERAGVPVEKATMIGDARWDAIAATRVGVRTIGVLSGGIGADELLEAGAAAVVADVAELLERLEDEELGLLPG